MLNSLIGNKTAEKDIRDWLSTNGWYGNSAEFTELELHAIKRPGWLQVFRFSCNVKSRSDTRTVLHGVMRDDERFKRTEINAFESLNAQRRLLNQWSEGLIVTRSQGSADKTQAYTQAMILIGIIYLLGLLASQFID